MGQRWRASEPGAGARPWRLLLAGLCLLAVSSTIVPAMADTSGPALTIGDGTGGVRATDAPGLLSRADEAGRLPVIVGFAYSFVPEGDLSAPQAARQQEAIAARQQAIVGSLAAAENVKRFETIPFMALTVTRADLRRLLNDPGIVSIAEDVAVPPTLNQSIRVINAQRAWSRGFRGNGWAVAVLDTGVQRDHSAFSGKIVAEACYSTTLAGRSRSVCPGGVAASTRAGSGANCAAGVRGCDHGTHVAGIAVGNHGTRPGVARGGSLIPMQVFSRFNSDADCGAGRAPCALSFSSDQIRALERVLVLARNRKIAAVNMSLGGGQHFAACDTSPLKAVIDNLRSRRIATVIASGNDGFTGSIGSPACISTAVAVGSTTKADEVSSFSNHAGMVALMAPGSSISAPVLANRVGVKSGTSMATPHVAGAWAQLMQARPRSTVQEVLRALVCTGEDVTRGGITKPRIDVDAAIDFLRGAPTSRSWNFSTAGQFRQWRKDLGRWTHSGAFMRATGAQAPVWLAATSPFCSSDLTVDARVRRVDPDTGFNWNSGLFLFSKVDVGKNLSGLWFAYNKSGGGQAVIWRVQGLNGLTNSGGASSLLCINSAGINVGGFNRLRVVSRNGVHRFLINGTEVCSAIDRTFGAGDLGMVMANPGSNAGHRYDVDTVAVTQVTGATALDLVAATGEPLSAPPGVSPLGSPAMASARLEAGSRSAGH